MSKIIPNIKERVLQIAENQEKSKQDFFKKVNLKYSNFTGKSKQSDLTSGAVAEIILNYPEINPMWLLTGNGEMLIKDPSSKINKSNAKLDTIENIIAERVLTLLAPKLDEIKNVFTQNNNILELLKLRDYIDVKIEQIENPKKSSIE